MPRLRIPHKLRDHDEGQFNHHFLDFAAHYLFDPSACNLRSPHEKGRVENAAKYIKNNFLAGRTFSSLADCNQPAALWIENTANGRLGFYAKNILLTPTSS